MHFLSCIITQSDSTTTAALSPFVKKQQLYIVHLL